MRVIPPGIHFIFGPVFVAAVAPYNPAAMDWAPCTALVLEQPYSLHTVEPGLQEGDAPYGWQPRYPDSFLVKSPHAPLAPFYFAPATTPAPAQNIDEFAWRGDYPDQIARAGLTAPSYFAPAFTPAPAQNEDEFSWRPDYPDRIDRAGPHASQQRAYFRPEHPLAAAPPLAWDPVYPDRIDPPRGLGSDKQRAFVFDPFPIAVPTDQLGWRGDYPDQIPRLETHASRAPAYFKSPLPMPAAPHLSWGPVYPVRIDPARALGAASQRAFFFDPAPIAVPVAQLGWRGHYPVWIPRLEVHASQQTAYFKSPLPMAAAPLLSWRPQYPVAIEPPRALLTAQQRAFFFDPFPIAVPIAALGWRGEWPDLINRREVHPSQIPAYFKSPLPMPAAPLLSWRGEQPVWLPPVRLHAAHRPAIFRAPQVEVVPLSWAADYPDQVHRLPWRELSYSVTPYLVQPIATLGWRGEWADYITRLEVHASRVPSVFLPEGFQPAQAVPPLAWLPVYPDFARGDRIFRLELVAYLGTQTITPLPFAVEHRNALVTFPMASDFVIVFPIAGGLAIVMPVADDILWTPSED